MISEKDCIFCKIARGEIPSKKVFEDSESFAFLDINPRAPGHTLVVPKQHAETMLDMDEEDVGILFMNVRKVAGKVMSATKAQGLSIGQSNGPSAGQLVGHVHVHIIPRFATESPPGLESIIPTKRIDDKSMDQIASAIRAAEAAEIEPKPKATEPQKPVAQTGIPKRMDFSPRQQPAPAKQPQNKPAKDDDDLSDDIDTEEIDEDMFKF
jgi:histidine triad (HIT) family protein